MQTFEIKRGHGKTLENGGLKKLMEEEFGSVENPETSIFNASFKALKSITVEFRSIKEIGVETETDNEASPEDSLAAHQAYNRFMEAVTSFNAKQRVDRAKARAKKEAKAAAEKEMQS
tara:strand:- start:538 stop:891 length:354 start_codon:yes stop_codon:yes gene_type:complete